MNQKQLDEFGERLAEVKSNEPTTGWIIATYIIVIIWLTLIVLRVAL
jgi:hypothetical protein